MLDRGGAAGKKNPLCVEGGRLPKPSLRTEKYQTRAAKKSSTTEVERGDYCQANDPQNSLEPTAERRYPEVTRNSYMRIRAPDILRRFMTIDLQNEPLVYEARLGISEGKYQEKEDMLARKLEEEGLWITDNRCDSIAGTETERETGADEIRE